MSDLSGHDQTLTVFRGFPKQKIIDIKYSTYKQYMQIYLVRWYKHSSS